MRLFDALAETFYKLTDLVMRVAPIGVFALTAGVVGSHGAEVLLPLAGVIDFAAERTRLTKEIAKTQGDITKTEAKLANEDFVRRAPEEIVEENRERLVEWRARVEKLQTALERVSG